MPFDDTSWGGSGGGRDNADDIGAVLFFLRGAAEDCLLFNTFTGRQAFDAFARLLDHDPETLWLKTGDVSE